MTIRGEASTLLSAVVWTPRNLEEAWEKKRQLGSDACFISGGTLLQTQWETGIPVPAHLISLERIQEMQRVNKELDGDRTVLRIGALTTLADCRHHPLIAKDWGLLAEAVKHIAAPAVRNRATIGGNVSNRYGDSIPALLVMDAKVTLFTEKGYKTEELWEWLKKDPRQAEWNEALLACIYLPETVKTNITRRFYKKIGRREAFVVSLVTVSGYYSQNNKGEIEHIRLAAGGGENQPQRLTACERLLQGTIPDEELWREVSAAILEEFQPVSDAFASADYRRKVAANVIISELMTLTES